MPDVDGWLNTLPSDEAVQSRALLGLPLDLGADDQIDITEDDEKVTTHDGGTDSPDGSSADDETVGSDGAEHP